VIVVTAAVAATKTQVRNRPLAPLGQSG